MSPLCPIFPTSLLLSLFFQFLALSVGDALGRPATVKCRIGVDDEDSYEGTEKKTVQETFQNRFPNKNRYVK